MSEIMLVNPRKKRRKRRRRHYVRGYYRNPIEPETVSLFANPRKRRRYSRKGFGAIGDIAITTAGTVGNLVIPSMLRQTGTKKYLIQGGLTLGMLSLGKNIFGSRIAKRLGLGMAIGLGLQIVNDYILKPKGKQLLSQDNEEIPEIEQEEIPEIEQEETVIIPEKDLEDIEPESISEEEDYFNV